MFYCWCWCSEPQATIQRNALSQCGRFGTRSILLKLQSFRPCTLSCPSLYTTGKRITMLWCWWANVSVWLEIIYLLYHFVFIFCLTCLARARASRCWSVTGWSFAFRNGPLFELDWWWLRLSVKCDGKWWGRERTTTSAIRINEFVWVEVYLEGVHLSRVFVWLGNINFLLM